MARPKKEEKEEENWLIENELQLRSEIPYTFFENIPIEEIEECIIFEIIKRWFIPLPQIGDYKHITYKTIKKVNKLLEIDLSLDINSILEYIRLKKNDYDDYSNMKNLKVILEVGKNDIYKLKGIFKKGNNNKSIQQKGGDFLFIWDSLNWGSTSDFILNRINKYEIELGISTNMSRNTYNEYKNRINKMQKEQPTEQTLELFLHLYS